MVAVSPQPLPQPPEVGAEPWDSPKRLYPKEIFQDVLGYGYKMAYQTAVRLGALRIGGQLYITGAQLRAHLGGFEWEGEEPPTFLSARRAASLLNTDHKVLPALARRGLVRRALVRGHSYYLEDDIRRLALAGWPLRRAIWEVGDGSER